jgi:hypothetical protein
MFSKKYLAALCLAFSFSATAHADFELTNHRGTGCPTGTARAVVSPDGQSMSILFDRLLAAVPQTDGNNDNDQATEENDAPMGRRDDRLDHKVCNLVITATLPQGERVQSLDISLDYRGFTHVERGVRAAFRSSLLQRKGLGRDDNAVIPLEQKVWRGNQAERAGTQDDDWNIHTVKSIPVQSRCASRADRSIRFVLRNVLVAQIQRQGAPDGRTGQISLDSSDLRGQMKFAMRTQRCAR